MKKGIRIIERALRVDRIKEEAVRLGPQRAYGALPGTLHVVQFTGFRVIQPLNFDGH